MWRFRTGVAPQNLVRVVFLLVMAGLTGGCFQPLYGSHTIGTEDSVRDKLASVDIPEIRMLFGNTKLTNGTQEARIAVSLRNALEFDFNGGGAPGAPLYRLDIALQETRTTVIVDVSSGRPDAQVEGINANFTLVEIATQKPVVNASTFARASFDIPGSAQRFAQQRAARNGQDRAVDVLAQNIRNRLASYFVAGT